MATAAKHPSRERTRTYRERLRAQGLKPVTIWVPDINKPEVRAQLERDCRLISRSPHERETMDFVESVSDWPLDEPGMPDYDAEAS